MSQEEIYLSIVAPAHNEAANLHQLVEEIHTTLISTGHEFEIVIINDGSTDETHHVLHELMGQYPQLRVLNIKERSGQTAALEVGLHNTRGCIIATLDADLQNNPTSIPTMLRILEKDRFDLVNGWRADRKDSLVRLFSTKIANWVRNKITNENIRDSACGLKVFRRSCLGRIKLFNGMHRFLPTLFRIEGFRVTEIPVDHRPRIAGKGKYGISNRLFCGLIDTFAVRWMKFRKLQYEYKEGEMAHVACNERES